MAHRAPVVTPRRTEGRRVGGRSARVVDLVVKATLDELGLVGYAALRVEDVARRSGVNKTTIYRRWPSKIDLVAAAVRAVRPDEDAPADTGELRGDLLALVAELHALVETPSRMAIARLLHAEQQHPEVDELKRSLRAESMRRRELVIARALARGELPVGSDASLLAEVIFTPLVMRLIVLGLPVDQGYAEQVIDLVLGGARRQPSRK
jgi:AcrR family transcriptional regulator